MKKTNKFLLALILLAATSKIAFCMEQEPNYGIISNEERVSELYKEIHRDIKEKLKNFELNSDQAAKNRDRKIGNLSVLENNVLGNICEWLDLQNINNISKCNKLLNELFNSYMETPKKDSNKNTNLTLDLSDFKILTKKSNHLTVIQKNMPKFINGTERTLNIYPGNSNVFLQIALENRFPESKLINGKQYMTINKTNINDLEENNLNLDAMVTRKDLIKGEIKNSNAAFLITASSVILPVILVTAITCQILKNKKLKTKDWGTLSRLLLSSPIAIGSLKLTLSKFGNSTTHGRIQNYIDNL